MPFEEPDESITIPNPKGTGFINQMKSGRQMVPRFQGEKDVYDSLEEADSMAAKRSQYEYDELRRDPSNQWYMPGTQPPPLLKNPGPSMHTPPTPDTPKRTTMPDERSMLDTITNGLQMLQTNQADPHTGFDADAHTKRVLSTGPFAEAAQRHAVWNHVAGNPSMALTADPLRMTHLLSGGVEGSSEDAAHGIRLQTSGAHLGTDPTVA